MLEKIKQNLAFFLRRKRYLIEHTPYEVADVAPNKVLLRRGFRTAEYVVPRNLCFYKLFDLSGIKKEFRPGALNIQIRKWSPIEDFQHCVIWNHGFAQVWVAPSSLVPDTKFLAESLFLGNTDINETQDPDGAMQNRTEIVAIVNGFEGRVWRNRVL